MPNIKHTHLDEDLDKKLREIVHRLLADVDDSMEFSRTMWNPNPESKVKAVITKAIYKILEAIEDAGYTKWEPAPDSKMPWPRNLNQYIEEGRRASGVDNE